MHSPHAKELCPGRECASSTTRSRTSSTPPRLHVWSTCWRAGAPRRRGEARSRRVARALGRAGARRLRGPPLAGARPAAPRVRPPARVASGAVAGILTKERKPLRNSYRIPNYMDVRRVHAAPSTPPPLRGPPLRSAGNSRGSGRTADDSTRVPSAAAADWLAYGRDVQLTNESPQPAITPETAPALHGLWSTTLDGPIVASPLAANGRLFVATETGSVYSLDPADVSVAWRTPL